MSTIEQETPTMTRDFRELIELQTLSRGDRTIAYSILTCKGYNNYEDVNSGSDEEGENDSSVKTLLFFYPAGGSRRLLASFHPIVEQISKSTGKTIRLICVNRPGRGGTSRAEASETSVSVTTTYAQTVCDDALAVLDELKISKASILTMCAGTPFGMAFATRYPDRCGFYFLAIAGWVLPADCGPANTSRLYAAGASSSSFWLRTIVAPTVGSCMGLSVSLLPMFSRDVLLKAFSSKLSTREWNWFQSRESLQATKSSSQPDECVWTERMRWIQEERGGDSDDVKVLLSAGDVVGIDYDKLPRLLLFHGTDDQTVPFISAEWLHERIESSKLYKVKGGTHDGVLSLLYPEIPRLIQAVVEE